MAKQQQQQLSKEEDSDDSPRKCAMWMSKKRRFCAMAPLPTSIYCGNHKTVAGEKRVPCPIDPSHTILEENVEAHVKKCPATKISKLSELQSYFCQGVNEGCHEEDRHDLSFGRRDLNAAIDPSFEGDKRRSSTAKRQAIAGLSEDHFREFIKRIESAHEVRCLGIEEEEIFQPPQCSKWWDPDRDRRLPFQEKHVSQQASLLGNLEAFGLLRTESRMGDSKLQDDNKNWVYVEFGAGRGYLSHMLCDSFGISSVVLVERSAYKFKNPPFIEDESTMYMSKVLAWYLATNLGSEQSRQCVAVARWFCSSPLRPNRVQADALYRMLVQADRTLRQILGVSVERLRTDIEDLQLHGVSSLQGRHFVAVSKHLCGPATDLTLRCCLNVNSGISSKSSDDQRCCVEEPILEGIGIATCCHHLCQWKSYVNKEFFRKLGFSISDFDMMTWLTSWAVNRSGKHDYADNKIMDQEGIRQGILEALDSAAQDRPPLSDVMNTLDPSERSVLGRKCKDLLDHGRLLWLKQHGLDVKSVKYVSSAITPENKLLLARKCYPHGSPKIAI